MKSIIECEIESANVIMTVHLTTTKECANYTMKVIDALLKHMAASGIIEEYSIYENNN